MSVRQIDIRIGIVTSTQVGPQILSLFHLRFLLVVILIHLVNCAHLTVHA